MTVGLYIRVSTEEQVREGYSISAQREKLKAFCMVQGWEDFRFYVDEGISAKDTDRPQLQLMLNHIEQGMIKTVLVYRLDRLTRSVFDLYKLLERFDEYGCAFKSATEVYDTSTAMGRMFITIVAALAQWERENLGERVRMGQIEKSRQGLFSAQTPYGFEKDENDRLVINEEEKKVLLDMINKIKSGHSIRQLSDYLNTSGIPPVRGYKWHIGSITGMLKNPVLYGAIRWRDEIIENAHEGIISKDEFEHLLRILDSRRNFKKRQTYSVYVFQMKLICPNCKNRLGSEMSKYFRKRDNSYVENVHYRCQSCALERRPNVNVSEKKIEKALLEYIQGIEFDKIPNNIDENETDNEKEILESQLKRIENQREKYQRAWSNDLITDDEFKKRMEETKRAYSETKEMLDSASPKKEQDIDVNKIKTIVNNFRLNWSYLSQSEKRKFINLFIEGIEFRKNKDVEVLHVHFY